MAKIIPLRGKLQYNNQDVHSKLRELLNGETGWMIMAGALVYADGTVLEFKLQHGSRDELTLVE